MMGDLDDEDVDDDLDYEQPSVSRMPILCMIKDFQLVTDRNIAEVLVCGHPQFGNVEVDLRDGFFQQITYH